MEKIDDPEKFETYVQFVYKSLMNLSGEGVQVAHRAKVSGRSGSWYEIDVYYQFERAGITHRVAFECKYWKRPVDRDAVLAFHSKLSDIGNINGVMVSHAGFQRGTKEYAHHYGIDIRTLEDLPSFRESLAMRIAAVGLPNPKKRPEPFWCLQTNDGSFYGQRHPAGDGMAIPLFISKLDAEATRQARWEKELVVTGLPLASLNYLVGSVLIRNDKSFVIVVPNVGGPGFVAIPQTAQEVKERYVDPVRAER